MRELGREMLVEVRAVPCMLERGHLSEGVMMAVLRGLRILIPKGNRKNFPYKRHIVEGHFEVVFDKTEEGYMHNRRLYKLYVTPKGVKYIGKRFKKMDKEKTEFIEFINK